MENAERKRDLAYLRQERSTLEALREEDVDYCVHGFGVMKSRESRVENDADERVEDDDLEVLLVRLSASRVHKQRDIGLGRSDMLVRSLINLLEENLKWKDKEGSVSGDLVLYKARK
jgi:hypothetical protein